MSYNILSITGQAPVSYRHLFSVWPLIHAGAMGRRIDPSWGGPIELFLISVSAPRLV